MADRLKVSNLRNCSPCWLSSYADEHIDDCVFDCSVRCISFESNNLRHGVRLSFFASVPNEPLGSFGEELTCIAFQVAASSHLVFPFAAASSIFTPLRSVSGVTAFL